MNRRSHHNLWFFVKAVSLYAAVLLGLLVSVFVTTTPASAEPSYTVNYQGKLSDSTGLTVANGDYDIVFKLYTAPTGGAAIWTETRSGANDITVTNGLFSVMLGSVTSLSSVNFNQPLYLGVTIEADSEMTPRKAIGTVPSAFEARQLGGVASTSFLRSDQADTATSLLTFSGGFLSTASSTATRLSFINATGTSLYLGGDRITDFTGTGLAVTAGALGLSSTYLGQTSITTLGTITTGTWNGTTIAKTYLDTDVLLSTELDTSSELAALLGDETGTGRSVFSISPAFSGTATLSALTATSTLTLSGTAANIALGSNYLSGDGDDEGVFVGSTGNVGIGTSTPNQKLSIFNNAADSAIEFSSLTGSPYKWAMGIDYSDGAKFKISSSSALGTNDRFTIDGAGSVASAGTITVGGNLAYAANSISYIGNWSISQGSQSLSFSNGNWNAAVSNTGNTPGRFLFTPAATAAVTASTERTAFQIDLSGIKTHLSGNLTLQRDVLIQGATHGFTAGSAASTITDGATFAVTGPPLVGAYGSMTNAHGILLQSRTLNASTTNAYGLTINASTNATNNYAAQFMGGNVGVGDSSPAGLFTVGNGDLFTVNSSGGVMTSASSTIQRLSFLNATGTSLFIGGDRITDFTGTGLAMSSNSLTVSLGNDSITANNIKSTGQTDEFCLTYETTGTTFEWQTCGGGGSMAIGGAVTSGTTGSVLFVDGGNLAQDNAEFFFNNTTNRLGLGTTTPNQKLTVQGNINLSSATGAIYFDDIRYIYASSANDSIVFGENAGATFYSGSQYNVALGYEAGRYASTTSYNVMIGYLAGESSTSSSNVLIGVNAGQFNTGYSNVSIGYSAGDNNSGDENQLLGSYAGSTNTGDYNNFFGYAAGRYNTGDYNEFIGTYSAYRNNGDFNQIIGSHAGYGLKSTSTVAIGSEALFGPGSSYVSLNNVALGYRAGYVSANGSGNNILIGYQVADNLTTGNNNIIIGYDIDSPTATADNILSVGNILFGTGISSSGTTVDADALIGIGTSSPNTRFTVTGPTTPVGRATTLFSWGPTYSQELHYAKYSGLSGGGYTNYFANNFQQLDVNATGAATGIFNTAMQMNVTGSGATDYNYLSNIEAGINYTGTNSNQDQYSGIDAYVYNSSGYGVNKMTGGAFGVINRSANSTSTTMTGVYAYVGNSQANTRTGDAIGLDSYLDDNQATDLITNWYGMRARFNNTGTVTNTYGVYVGDITSGTQTNSPYSFYAFDSGAKNYFAGSTGIGTTTPTAKLDVQGSAEFGTGNVALITTAGKITGLSNTYFGTDTSANLAGILTDETGSSGGVAVFSASPTFTGAAVFAGATFTTATTTNLVVNGERFTDLTGTGLAFSANTLTASLGTDITAAEIANGDHGAFTYSSGAATLDNNAVTPNAILSTGQTDEFCLTYETTGTTFEWQTCGGGGSLFTDGGATTYLTASGDNLGIGTSTANQALSIFRNAADSALEFSSASGANYKWSMGIDYSDAGKFKISSSSALGTNDRLTIDGNGRVKIFGDGSNGTALEVTGGIQAYVGLFTSGIDTRSSPATVYTSTGAASTPDGAYALTTTNDSGLNGAFSGQTFRARNTSNVYQNGYIGVTSIAGAAQYTPHMVFGLQTGAATYAEYLRLTSSGNVGIGTTTPNQKLTVYNSIASADSAIEFSGASGSTYKWTVGMDNGTGAFKISSSSALGTNDRMTIDGSGSFDFFGGAQFGTGNIPLITSGGKVAGLSSTYFTTDSSANLATIINDETGAGGVLVFNTAPTFTGTTNVASIIASASSTISRATFVTATTTNLVVNGERFTDLTGTGLAFSANTLTASLGTDITAAEIANGDHGFFTYASGVASLDTGGLTSANLSGALTDETGSGVAVFGTAPTFTTSITSPLIFGGTAAGSSLTLQSTSGVGTTDFIKFAVGNAGATEAARFTSLGRLGIGTTTPNGLLTVFGTNPQGSWIESASEFLRAGVGETANTSILGWDNADSFRFGIYDDPYDTTLTDYMTITSAGKVGIGTTTPNWELQVTSADPYIAISDTNAPTNEKHFLLRNDGGVFKIGTSSDALGAASTALTLDPVGTAALGIGTTTPWRTLSVVGTAALNGLSAVAGTDNSICIDPTTKEITTQAGDTCAVSASRYKHDIEKLGADEGGLSMLMKLDAVSYVYNDDPTNTLYWGLIADKAASTSRQLAYFNPDGSVQTLNTFGFLALFTKSIQELNLNLNSIASTTATSTAASRSFAEGFFKRIGDWLGEKTNGITSIFAKKVETEKLCVSDEGGKTCITRDELDRLLDNANTASVGDSQPPPPPAPEPQPDPTPEPEPAPEPTQEPPPPDPEPTPEPSPEVTTI